MIGGRQPGQVDGTGRGTWWVDERGNWRLVDPASSRDHLSRPFGPGLAQESAGYRVLGCAKVVIGEGSTSVTWDVRDVETEAMRSILAYLKQDCSGRPIVLKFFFAGWITERWPDGPAACGRVEHTIAYRDVELMDTVLMDRLDIADVATGRPVVRRAYDLWLRSGGRFDGEGGLAPLSRRLLAFELGPHDDGLVFAHAGADSFYSQVYGVESAQRQIGLPSDYNGPDQAFADRVCRSYVTVLAEETPRYDHVRALIHRDIGEPLWAPYQRLLLPCRRSDGTPLLVCLTSVTQDVRIPFLQARSSPIGAGTRSQRIGH